MPARRLDPETRRRVMSSIHKRDTLPERTLRTALWAAGLRGWRCCARLPGTPDIVFSRWRLAIFVDGVWWHGHPDYLPMGRRGAYWDQKIAGNQIRDKEVNRQLRELGWSVIRIWDVDVIENKERAATVVVSMLRKLGWSREALPQLKQDPGGSQVWDARRVAEEMDGGYGNKNS